METGLKRHDLNVRANFFLALSRLSILCRGCLNLGSGSTTWQLVTLTRGFQHR